MNLAIVGGGVFGSMAAWKLASLGHAVTLFERSPTLMQGASLNNQNRLHLGFHYPRDDETARQCRRGFARFCQEFEPCIRGGFPNAYFIASEGSRTTPEAFLRFCERHALAHRLLDVSRFRPRVQGMALGLLTDEVVFDAAHLRRLIGLRLEQSGVQVQLGCPVTGVASRGPHRFELTYGQGQRATFDGVVNCSYASINALTQQLGHRVEPRQYEYTAVAVVELDWPSPAGLTVLDGPFMTLLPFGHTRQHLLYHVQDMVIARQDGLQLEPGWLDPETSPFAAVDKQAWFERLRERCSAFVPDLRQARLTGFLQGPRMVMARSDDTDARPSLVTVHEPGYLTVFSGKIDHCVWAVDEVAALLDEGQLERRRDYRSTEITLPERATR